MTNIGEKFDLIALRMVLEHMPYPSKAFKKLNGLLKKKDQLVIIVPDFSGVEFRLFKEYCYALQVPNHLNHFTPSTIRQYCEKYGFKVDRIIHHQFDRDFVASTQYMKEDGLKRWLAPVLSNKIFRNIVLKAVVLLLSYSGMTSRMTIWAKRR